MADKTTGGLPAVQESPIGGLPPIMDLYRESLIPVEQQGEARHMTGGQFADFAREAAKQDIDRAVAAADRAGLAADSAAKSAAAAAGSETAAANSALSAQQYSGKPPVIIDGRWWVWNADKQEYVDTGEATRGNLMYATFYLDPLTGDLYMFSDNEYTGPRFRLNGPDLEVVVSYGS